MGSEYGYGKNERIQQDLAKEPEWSGLKYVDARL